MTHVKQFKGISMSKSMRGLCKEEDYAFLGMSKETAEASGAFEDDSSTKKEERAHRQLEREQREKERLRKIEEGKKEREQQWRTHVAELSSQEKTLQERLSRLRRFREFQRKVLIEESGMEAAAANDTVYQLLTRM